MSFTGKYKQNLASALEPLDLSKIDEAIDWFRQARDENRQIFLCGNGGSACTASHFVQDMLKGASYGRDRRFRILCLNDSAATTTAYSNDVAYEHAYVEQLRNFAQSGDLVVVLSGSGNSSNAVRMLDYANSIGCRTIAMTGRDGGRIGPMADLEIRVSDHHMGRIEDGHHVALHMICYYFMETDHS